MVRLVLGVLDGERFGGDFLIGVDGSGEVVSSGVVMGLVGGVGRVVVE